MANEVWKEYEDNQLTHSAAHYLMTIHELLEANGYARVTDIAKRLNITRGSCSISLKPLKRRGLVLYTERSLNPLRRRIFRLLLKWAQRYAPYREEALFYVGAAWPALRRLALELGRRLTEAGSLHKPDDVFFLYSAELSAAGAARAANAGRPDLADLAQERRQLREARKRLDPPIAVPPGARFQFGPLDQGWWPDGLYTAPSDKALRYDIQVLKKLGCNMLRKHVKIEPDRLYHWCDKMGLLVWQDMPSGDKYIRGNQPDIISSGISAFV